MAYLCEAVLQFAGSARNGTYLACRWVCERSRGVLRPCEANDGDPPGRASRSETPAPNRGQARRDRRGVGGDKAEEAEEDGCVLTCFLNKQLKEESPQPPRSRRALPEEATPLPRQSALRNEGHECGWGICVFRSLQIPPRRSRRHHSRSPGSSQRMGCS